MAVDIVKIAASLGVKDEVELIEPAISHLRAIGVDLIIACDFYSSDGTFEVLERYRSDRDFWLFRLSDREEDRFEPWRRTTLALVKSADVDWAIFLDADEFWLPASGNLKDCACLSEADVLSVDRYNVPVSVHGALFPDMPLAEHYDELMLILEMSHDLDAELQENPSMPWMARATSEPKLMARPERISGLFYGAHFAISENGQTLETKTPQDLIIAHLPFTTMERFKRKVDNIRGAVEAHEAMVTGMTAWHWKRWLKLADEGGLETEFERSVWQPEKIAALRRQGSVRSAAEAFSARGALATEPTPNAEQNSADSPSGSGVEGGA